SLDKWSGFRSWVDDINNFSTRMTNGFASRDGQYQSKDAMGRIRFDASQEANTLRSRADMYRNHFAENQAHYDSLYGAGTTEKILQNLSHNTNYLDSVLTDLTNEYNRWSQFENEDQYNEHVRLSNLDLDTARKELAELEAQLEEAEKARNNAYLRPDLLEGMGVGGDGSPFSIDMSNTHLTPEGIEDVQSQYNELNDRVNALRQDIYNAEYLQKGQNYAALTQSLDFETYAKQGAAMDSPIKDTEGDGLFYSIGETLGGKNPYSYLTDDEASIYNYLLAKEGEKSAQEYLDFMRETLNARSGAEIAGRVQGSDNWLDRFLAHGVYSVGGGLSQFASGIGQLFSEERLPTTPIQFANQELAEDLDGLGYYAFQAGTTVGNMLPAIAVTLATGGLGASAGVASTVGAATVGLSSGGNAYNQALAEGYTTEQARDYGIAVGASEAILERLLGGVGSKLGISEEMLLPKIRMIDKAWARIALTGTVKFGAEITEEELQLFLEPAYRTIIFGEDYELPEVQEILETAIITALSTGMLESGSIVSAGKTPQTDITAKPGNTEPLQMTAQDNATLTQRDEAAPEGEIPTQTENAPSADERATAAAYEAGRANVPRESITLETPAQEEAYNNGRIEYIKNTAQPTDTTQQSVETAPATEQRMPKGMEKAAINTAMVRDAAASLGENGAKALAHVYTPEIAAQYSPTKVAVAFAKLYNATLDGKEIDADLAKEVKGLPATIRMAAVDSAKNDAVIAKQAKYFGEDAKLVKDNNWKMANLSTKDTRKLDALAKVLGVQIRFAPKVADGAANAQYIRGTNGGIIELALDGNDPFMTSAVHEAIHRIREAAPEMYGELSEFVRHNMSRDAKYMAMGERALRYQTDNVRDIIEEMVADAFGRMMNDSEVLSKFAGEHRTVVQRIMDAIRDMINAVKRALNGQNVELTENQKAEFRDLQDKLTEMEKVFRTALKESEVKTEQRKTTTTRDGVLTRTTDADGTTVLTTANDNPVAQMDEDGSALFSLKTYEAFGRAELKRWLDLRVSKNLLSKEDAADIVKQLDEYYDLCQQFKNKYAPFGAWSEASVVTDNKGKPVFSVVKANGEYAMNLDFSLVCKKRRTLDAVFGEMIKRDVMNFVTLEEADIVKINDIIRENGFETACALCFVDSKRYRQAKVTDSFVSQYNELVRMLLPEGGDVKAHHFDFVESGHYKNGGTGLHTVSNAELAEGINKLKQVMRENGSQTVAHKIAKHLLNHPSDRKLVDRSDFMNTDGFVALNLKNPAVMNLYNSSKGSGGPKAAFSDVQYLGEILSKKGFAAQKAYLVGGVRIQSFSDYIPRLVFDYL
ncbi:MAG: hypothetical protein J6S14_20125, partial [Clostridia bacterium]|nr:hypothetical protein [Clostridia bacterium]